MKVTTLQSFQFYSMKYIFIVVFGLLIGTNCNAQDFCKKVKKEVELTTYTYTSPYDTTTIPEVKITRSYSIDTDNEFDNFVITFQTVSPLLPFMEKNPGGSGDFDEKKLTVEFADKSKYVEDSIVINYEKLNEQEIVVRTVYVNLDEKTLKDFSAKPIAKFKIGDAEKIVASDTATAYMNYIQCIKNTKK